MSGSQTHKQDKVTTTKLSPTQKAQVSSTQIRSIDYASLHSTTPRRINMPNILLLQRIVGNREVSRLLAENASHNEVVGQQTYRNTIQRNSDAAQTYTPPAVQAMQAYFRNNHVPANYTVLEAINIHNIRGAIPLSTIISMTNEDAREEIEGYLLGLDDTASDNLVNLHQITFTTAQEYPFIETALDTNNAPVLRLAAIGRIRLRAQWNNGGYYQLYHCDGPTA